MILRSALRPVHLVLLIVSLLMLIDPPARIIGMLGVLLYTAVVWHDAAGRRLEEEAEGEEQERDGAAPPVASSYREQALKAEAALRRIHSAADGSGRSLARVLAPITRQADQVVRRLCVLVERAEQLSGFLGRQNRENLDRELTALDQRIAACSDEFAREQYLQARRTREEQLHNYDELALCLGRVEAQITNVLSSLEAAEARVIMLQAADLRHAGDVTDEVTRSLQELSHEMTGFQEGIDATIAVRMRQ